MKTLKYFAASAMLAIASVANAQNADLSALENALKNNSGNPAAYKTELKAAEKLVKKDAAGLAQMADLLLQYDDIENARIYAEKCVELGQKKNKVAASDGYITLARIQYIQGDPGAATANYELAIVNNPDNADPYEKVAHALLKANPTQAVNYLKKYKEINASYPADAVAGYFFYEQAQAGEKTFGKALQHYQIAEKNNELRNEDYVKYAYVLYLYAKHNKCAEIADKGLQVNPNDVQCLRYKMYSLQTLGRNEEAVATAQRLHACPDYEDYVFDYKYEGQAYCELKDFAKAKTAIQKSLDMKSDQKELLKYLSQIAFSDGDEETGMKYLLTYLDECEEADFVDYYNLVAKYDEKLKTAEGAAKTELLQKECDALNTMLKKYPGKQLVYVYYKLATANKQLDPSLATAVPYYEKLIEAAQAEDAVKNASTIKGVAKVLADHYKGAGNADKAAKYEAMATAE